MSRFLASCFAIMFLSMMVHGADDNAKSTVAKMNEAWLAAHKAADFDGLAALYTEDAVLMPDGQTGSGTRRWKFGMCERRRNQSEFLLCRRGAATAIERYVGSGWTVRKVG